MFFAVKAHAVRVNRQRAAARTFELAVKVPDMNGKGDRFGRLCALISLYLPNLVIQLID
jgi:hypothetical protein